MGEPTLSLGIDTSNYKTSVALVNRDGEILHNVREFLSVGTGEKGLRQSEAFFQHIKKLPDIIDGIFKDGNLKGKIGAVSVSTRPRPVEGSYMPVFLAGAGFAKTIASVLDLPLYEFSHQEGHIEAAKHYSVLKEEKEFICFHFSGGTTEGLLVNEDVKKISLVGGTRDISYGQVLDRLGVAYGMAFPCGQEMDDIALSINEKVRENPLSRINVGDGFINLSGIDTQCKRLSESMRKEELIPALFDRIALSILDMTKQICAETGIDKAIYAGGVSSSMYIRNFIKKNLDKSIDIAFAEPALSADNAVGIALLGGKKIWP